MERYRIAIVDDEIHALNHLRRMLQTQAPECEIAAAYTDANEALAELTQTEIDVLFIDIMMPALNGLDFSREYLKRRPNTTVIILTAYKDFDFAKQAVGIGVYDYWVKHELRPATIHERLEEVKEAVRKKREISERVRRQGVLEALSGQIPLGRLFDENETGVFFMLYSKTAGQASPGGMADMRKELERFAQKFQTDFTRFVPLADTAVAVGRIAESGGRARQRFEDLCAALPSFCAKGIWRMAAGDPTREEDYTPPVHQRCLRAFQNLFYAPEQRFRRLSAAGLELLLPEASMLLRLEKAYFESAAAYAQALELPPLLELARRVWRDPLITCGNLQAIRHTCARLWELGQMLSGPPAGAVNAKEMPERMGTEEMERFFSGWYRESFLLLDKGQTDQSQKIRQVAAYIQKNYSGDLRLKTLTQKFNISADYLRKLFKLETGQNLSDFITAVRIERSKQLLRMGEYKIYEIAELVGYHSAQYFSQAFFKATGAYPTDHLYGKGKQNEEENNPG